MPTHYHRAVYDLLDFLIDDFNLHSLQLDKIFKKVQWLLPHIRSTAISQHKRQEGVQLRDDEEEIFNVEETLAEKNQQAFVIDEENQQASAIDEESPYESVPDEDTKTRVLGHINETLENTKNFLNQDRTGTFEVNLQFIKKCIESLYDRYKEGIGTGEQKLNLLKVNYPSHEKCAERAFYALLNHMLFYEIRDTLQPATFPTDEKRTIASSVIDALLKYKLTMDQGKLTDMEILNKLSSIATDAKNENIKLSCISWSGKIIRPGRLDAHLTKALSVIQNQQKELTEKTYEKLNSAQKVRMQPHAARVK